MSKDKDNYSAVAKQLGEIAKIVRPWGPWGRMPIPERVQAVVNRLAKLERKTTDF